ncbi:striatin-interacting protein 1-like [Sycon ciliatum]|uniref:striatin-interacting protein 1-like n=1 Tax=Sycon ciliatum TaxID=27933 RepID=UPI0031F6ABCB
MEAVAAEGRDDELLSGTQRRAPSGLKDILKRQRQDSENESPDLNFVYADADTVEVEISELYSYTESEDFALNQTVGDEDISKHVGGRWREASVRNRKRFIQVLLNQLELACVDKRTRAVRSMLYLIQGVFGECTDEAEQHVMAQRNAYLLASQGGLEQLVELLVMELGIAQNSEGLAAKKPAVTLSDNVHTRLCCSILYSLIEYMRVPLVDPTQEETAVREQFITELGQPCGNNPCLAVICFDALVQFCSALMPPFPIRKLVLLLWKTVLVSLGGLQVQASRMQEARKKAGLPAVEYSVETVPAVPAETMPIGHDASSIRNHPAGLKARKRDVDAFINQARAKYVGFVMDNADSATLAGLPQPIRDSISVMSDHIYQSLGEYQTEEEEKRTENRLTQPIVELDSIHQPTEDLYAAMLPHLPQYMIALLKILLAAATTVKAKNDSINILVDVLPEEMPTTVVQSMKLGIDVNRHKEVIIKATSALLLLLLKHTKVNHVFQFEFICQHLVFANCIPLILKFLNQNISAFVSVRNSINDLDFPQFLFSGAGAELTAESLEAGSDKPFCWRNLFSCINLLRILQKLVKWKHSRTMMLVVFKSSPILKRAMKVKHPLMQLYILKLLKLQARYLGKIWRKSNMKVLASIYHRVRHRLNDDWAFGNDLEARPWDFQAVEVAMRHRVELFNGRRYNEGPSEEDPPANDVMADLLQKVDNNPISCMGQDVSLPQHFRENYEAWLREEVYHGTSCLPNLDESGLLVTRSHNRDSDETSPWSWVKST